MYNTYPIPTETPRLNLLSWSTKQRTKFEYSAGFAVSIYAWIIFAKIAIEGEEMQWNWPRSES